MANNKDPFTGAVTVAVDAASQAMHFAASGLRMISGEGTSRSQTDSDFVFERKLAAALEAQEVAYQSDIAALRQVITELENEIAELKSRTKKHGQKLKKLKGSQDV